MKKIAIAAGTAVCLAAVLGACSFGTGAAPEESPSAAPTAVKLSPACKIALEKADANLSREQEAIGLAGQAFSATTKLDSDGMDAVLAKMDTLTPKLQASRAEYAAARKVCMDEQ